jgi:two-component system, NarL family, sensor histidine kinase UhpB
MQDQGTQGLPARTRGGHLEGHLLRWHRALMAAAVAATVAVGLLLGSAMLPWQKLALAAVAVAAVAAGGGLYRRQVGMLLRPLAEIERAAAAAEAGNLGTRVDAAGAGDTELGRVAASLNRMLGGMAADRHRLRDVAARAFRAQEAERLRIARELQEETAQSLTTTLFLLRAARETEDRAAREELLDELRESLTRTTDSLRGYARALHPPSLKDLGLVPALEAYARTLERTSGLKIQIVADDVQGLLPAEGQLAVYRVVQEALGNIVRHANATSVLVRVRHMGEHVRTVVEDDGRGFGVDETEARLPCLGLFGMRERALSVGGTVQIDSIPGDGTRVRIEVPALGSPAAARPPWPVIVRPAEHAAAPGERSAPAPPGAPEAPGAGAERL